MAKAFFNTKTFDHLLPGSSIILTDNPKEADLLILGAKKVNFSDFSNLKAVYRFGIGSENVDFSYIKAHSLKLFFPSDETKEIIYDATANFAVFGLFHLFNEGIFGNADQWLKKERQHLDHKKVLVIGMGNIGKKVAFKLSPFMKVNTFDILTNRESELDDLLPVVDAITLHVPLTEDTKNLFNAQKLSLLKNNCMIVNTARGEIFDEMALLEKLKTSDCRAFFDVFWQEPYHGPLKNLGPQKFFMTPHSASNTTEFIYAGFNDIQKIFKEIK